MNTSKLQEIQDTIEALIDKVGIYDFLGLVMEICYDKAEHVRANWQDENLGTVWDKIGHRLDKAIAEAFEIE